MWNLFIIIIIIIIIVIIIIIIVIIIIIERMSRRKGGRRRERKQGEMGTRWRRKEFVFPDVVAWQGEDGHAMARRPVSPKYTARETE